MRERAGRGAGAAIATIAACVASALALGGAEPAAAGGSVVINEVGYAANPAGSNATKFEYVELFNPYSVSADITGWTLADSGGTLYVFSSLVVPAHAFVAVYSSEAAGTIAPDATISDGSATLIAGADWSASDLVNSGDAIKLSDPFGLLDFIYYDESNTGDVTVDSAAVTAGMWKSGAAIDTLSAATLGRAIALVVDGASPHEVDAVDDAEDLDWFQYGASPGGTPGRWNDPSVIFKDAFETGLTGYWTTTVNG